MRSTRRMMRAVEERRDLALDASVLAHELEQEGDREGGAFWRDVADVLHREQQPVPRPSLPALGHLHRGAVMWDRLTVDLVTVLRAQGASWAQIGAELEITGEAARKRYGRGEQ